MHYTEPIMRPPTEAYSSLIEVTRGCSHNKCSFCGGYGNTCFSIAPMEQIKSDIIEASQLYPLSKRVFLLSGNAFVMSFENLKQIALWINEYMPSCEVISMFSTINDIKRKSVEELLILSSLKMSYLYIGTETGSPEVLAFAQKGHTVEDALTQIHKLDQAGIGYNVMYITGLAGTGKGIKNAIESADFFNQISPDIIGVSSLSIYKNSKIGHLYQTGDFIPATELEMLKETRELLKNLTITTRFSSAHVSNMLPLDGMIPDNKEQFLATLDSAIASIAKIGYIPRYNRDERM